MAVIGDKVRTSAHIPNSPPPKKEMRMRKKKELIKPRKKTKGVQFKCTKIDLLHALARSPEYIKDFDAVFNMPFDPDKQEEFFSKYQYFFGVGGFPIDPHDSKELRKQLKSEKELERDVGALYFEDGCIEVKSHEERKYQIGEKTDRSSALRNGQYLTVEINASYAIYSINDVLREFKKTILFYRRFARPPKVDTYATGIHGATSIWEVYDMLSKDGMTPDKLARKLTSKKGAIIKDPDLKCVYKQITRARDKVIELIREAEKKIGK